MHEWALAESIVVAAKNAAEKEQLIHVSEIKVLLGELQQINEEIFRFALDEITKTYQELMENVSITIDIEPTKLQCNNCKSTWLFSDMKQGLNEDEAEAIHFIPEVAFVHTRCPQCKSPDFSIIKGRGVSISSIKGEKK